MKGKCYMCFTCAFAQVLCDMEKHVSSIILIIALKNLEDNPKIIKFVKKLLL